MQNVIASVLAGWYNVIESTVIRNEYEKIRKRYNV